MRKLKVGISLCFLLIVTASQMTSASMTLLDKDDWKFLFGGFVEMDVFADSTRSFIEVVGSNPVAREGTYSGDNDRLQDSIRNSRFSFSVLPPVLNDWKTLGYLEFDLLGFDPQAPGVSGVSNSEAGFYTNPTLRVRHAYFTGESNGWQILVGQSWTLFGWQPAYVLTTASVPPVTASSYQRTPEVIAIKNIGLNETDKIQVGLSVARPTQRDSDVPNVDAGLRYILGSYKSGFSSPSGDITAQPLSVGLSGTYRQYYQPSAGGATTDKTTYNAGAVAGDVLIPIIPSSDGKETGNTLTFTGEYTTGSGYSDAFPGMSWNLSSMTQASVPSSTSYTPNLDAGIAGLDAGNNFNLVKEQTWNTQLQYHFFSEWHLFTTLGYGQASSSNVGNLVAASGTTLYDKSEVYFINFFHDLSKQIRVAVEYDNFKTHYVDGMAAFDNRYQVSAWFRF